ncbi:DUF934 domain-containing protein [Salinispirillum sp. LH 10-3-1]|uniref:DUF934 domain-containing protein n=1 Tax=Salinispirillum sp. LH 10-3-1 TaxID=2952525 RepID=A0AB38YBU9_9GAMM
MLPNLILNDAAVSDNYTVVSPDDAVPAAGDVILPLALWAEQGADLRASGRKVGVWLASDQLAEDLSDSVKSADVIAIEFPKFADGRGFSTAYLVRNRLGYTGELRAIGDFLLDQLFFLRRVGFNAFRIPEDKCIEKGLELLNPINVRYQASTDGVGIRLA